MKVTCFHGLSFSGNVLHTWLLLIYLNCTSNAQTFLLWRYSHKVLNLLLFCFFMPGGMPLNPTGNAQCVAHLCRGLAHPVRGGGVRKAARKGTVPGIIPGMRAKTDTRCQGRTRNANITRAVTAGFGKSNNASIYRPLENNPV